MNALIEYEAGRLANLMLHGDTLGIRLFMEHMHIPLDVQDRLFAEMATLDGDTSRIASWLETHGQSTMPERLGN
ncbi:MULTISPECIES: hypothetical protein [Shewanella]|uniref:Uncharacterized protein n=2 Tax=Shewanella TaxID=22 RepID=A0A974XI86_9GAMM|nr:MULTISPECIES: hypothetical protein [Shewanella]QSX28784.1 hypothetical protein JYB88_10915 [Shewanella cyperi]QSX35901.1 hypothetical protein JYB85_11100 [Shewanella sedimentimangrovi]QSX39523.1 hypothetical protein JYB84_10785 [Shewanella cyperi]